MKARPFDFEAQLHPKSRRMDPVPFIDACLIAIFFSLFGSSYVFAPGITLRLPHSRTAAADALPIYEVLTVGEIEGSERILFDGRIFNLETFGQSLLSAGQERNETTLLVRVGEDVSVGTLSRVCDIARAAGFLEIQIAAEPEVEGGAGF
ncbi:MAG: biopolymer transporter ExbD [Opitutaceae bacterium]